MKKIKKERDAKKMGHKARRADPFVVLERALEDPKCTSNMTTDDDQLAAELVGALGQRSPREREELVRKALIFGDRRQMSVTQIIAAFLRYVAKMLHIPIETVILRVKRRGTFIGLVPEPATA